VQGRHLIVGTALVLASVVAAFFLTFNGLFSDGPRSPVAGERLVLAALLVAVHGLLAAAAVRWAGATWRTWALGVAAPSLAVCVLYPLKEPGIALLAAVEAVMVLAGAGLGAWLARPKQRPA
jgi:hypothetical protein